MVTQLFVVCFLPSLSVLQKCIINTNKLIHGRISWHETRLQSAVTIAKIMFRFLWDHWAHCGIIEKGVLLKYTLEGVSSVAHFITAYEKSQ